MDIERIAAFSDGTVGGNPAGVVLCRALPTNETMQATAVEVGYSETVFAAPQEGGWRVRYFAPKVEVDFCGHATIALGAVLARLNGDGVFQLILNHSVISVEGRSRHNLFSATLQSPPTRSNQAQGELVKDALVLFGLHSNDLDKRIPPAIANAGADHLILALKNRSELATMQYEFERGRELALRYNVGTFNLIHAETAQLFHARNPFPIGGVFEDPATGAAAAALAGYLRDLGWPHGGAFEIIQGEDMGMRSRLSLNLSMERGSSVKVSGTARIMT